MSGGGGERLGCQRERRDDLDRRRPGLPHTFSISSQPRGGPALFTLYTTPLSANGRKPLAVGRYLGLTPAVVEVNVYAGEGRTPEYLKINPWGKVPALVDGDLVLWESNAIVQYIAEAYGDGRLWSRDAKRKADICRWLFWEAAHWQPTMTRLLTDFVGAWLFQGLEKAQEVSVAWADEQFIGLARQLDLHLADLGYLTGGDPTIADFSVAAMMMYVRAAGFPFEEFPTIGTWFGRIEATEAWAATAPRQFAVPGSAGEQA